MKTNLRIGVGIAIIILGLMVILTPRYLFPVCEFAQDGGSSHAGAVAHDADGALLAQHGGSDEMAQAMDDMEMTDTTGTMPGMGTTTNGMDHGEMDHGDMGHDEIGNDEMDHGAMAATGHMNCYYTYRASVMLGLLVMLVGVAVMLATTGEAARLLALVLGGLGVAVITLPTYVLPICENPQMACHDGAEPLLIVIGALILAVAGGIAVIADRKKTPPNMSEMTD